MALLPSPSSSCPSPSTFKPTQSNSPLSSPKASLSCSSPSPPAFSRCSLWRSDASLLDSLRSSRVAARRSPRERPTPLRVWAAAGPNDGVKWWEKDGGPNVIDFDSSQILDDAVAGAGEKLLVVEFFATWCGSCRALYPKLCKLAAEYTDVMFLKVNFDENKPLCKSLNVKVLPYFHLYHGAAGQVDAFSCSITKLQRLKDAIATHSTSDCSVGPSVEIGDVGTGESSTTSTLDKPAIAGSAR